MQPRLRHPSSQRQQRGVSLVEILIGVTIGVIGILAIFQTVAVWNKHTQTTTSGGDAQIAGTLALFNLERDLKQAGHGFSTALPQIMGCPVTGVDLNPARRAADAFALSAAARHDRLRRWWRTGHDHDALRRLVVFRRPGDFHGGDHDQQDAAPARRLSSRRPRRHRRETGPAGAGALRADRDHRRRQHRRPHGRPHDRRLQHVLRRCGDEPPLQSRGWLEPSFRRRRDLQPRASAAAQRLERGQRWQVARDRAIRSHAPPCRSPTASSA